MHNNNGEVRGLLHVAEPAGPQADKYKPLSHCLQYHFGNSKALQLKPGVDPRACLINWPAAQPLLQHREKINHQIRIII